MCALLGLLLGVTQTDGPAAGGPVANTRLQLRPKSTTVTGRPVKIGVLFADSSGDPVPGAVVRLVLPADFLGSTAEEILDEATTGPTGSATLRFAPLETGRVEVTARVAESPLYGPAETSLTFRVIQPVPGYHKNHVGLGGRWTRSYLVLVPLVGVWLTYLVVLGQIQKIRRAGRPAGAVWTQKEEQ